MIRRRALLGAAGVAFATPALAQPAAQPWTPPRAVRLVVPYAPGGGADTTARLFAQPLTALLGQTVVVENRPGAGSTIGAGEVARAPADGTTLLLDASGHAVAPFLIRGLTFDYATAFAPISQVTVLPQIVITRPDSPHRDFAALLEAARRQPGRITYGSSGNASAPHLAAAVLLRRAGLEMTHVPYRGGGPALQALLAGDVDFAFATVSSAAALAQEGRVRPLAASSAQRISSLPEVPTVAELGFPGFEQNEWNGLWGPAGLPPAATGRLHAGCVQALADPTVKQRLAALGALTVGTAPAEFAGFLAGQRQVMAQLVRDGVITVD